MDKLLRIIKLIGIPFLIAIGIYTFIRFVWLKEDDKEYKFSDITVEEYLNLYYDSKESIVYIYNDTMSKKEEFEKSLENELIGKKTDIYYFNVTNLSDDEISDLLSITTISEKEIKNLPILVYTLNGDVYDILKGYQEEHYIRDFIERNNIG